MNTYAYLVFGLLYAGGAAITLGFVLRELRHGDGRMRQRWDDVADLTGDLPLVVAAVLFWPYVAWALRSGHLHHDRLPDRAIRGNLVLVIGWFPSP